jgi:hypothetical protein
MVSMHLIKIKGFTDHHDKSQNRFLFVIFDVL